MTYLKNDICDFEILFPLDLNKKKNIISSCFFKMNNHYKKFDIYINGVKNIIKLLERQNKYVLRLFIDENIKNDKEIFSVLESSKKIEIVVFKCLNYMNDNYHYDVFGSLIRFFPLFDFENNDSGNVIVIDIDLHEDDRICLKSLINFETNYREIVGRASSTPYPKIMKKELPHMMAGLMGYYNCKFDKDIIIGFIKNAHNIKDTGKYERRLTTFGYGVDELFINKYLLFFNDSIYIKNIKIGIIMDYNINLFLYYYKDILKKNENIYDNLKYILGNLYKENNSIDDMFTDIDNYIYNKKKITMKKNTYLLDTINY